MKLPTSHDFSALIVSFGILMLNDWLISLSLREVNVLAYVHHVVLGFGVIFFIMPSGKYLC